METRLFYITNEKHKDMLMLDLQSNKGESVTFADGSSLNIIWIVPKREVLRYQWVYRNSFGTLAVTEDHYTDYELAKFIENICGRDTPWHVLQAVAASERKYYE